MMWFRDQLKKQESILTVRRSLLVIAPNHIRTTIQRSILEVILLTMFAASALIHRSEPSFTLNTKPSPPPHTEDQFF